MNDTNALKKLFSIIDNSKDPEKALQIALDTLREYLSKKENGERIPELKSTP